MGKRGEPGKERELDKESESLLIVCHRWQGRRRGRLRLPQAPCGGRPLAEPGDSPNTRSLALAHGGRRRGSVGRRRGTDARACTHTTTHVRAHAQGLGFSVAHAHIHAVRRGR